MKIKPYSTRRIFYDRIGNKMVAGRGQQQVEGRVFCTKDNNTQADCNANDTEEHLAKHLKMLSECH